MFKQQVKEVNESLKRTNKAIVAIGCSFVQGQGAVNDELYGHFKWEMKGLGKPLEIVITEKEKRILLAKYPELRIQNDKIDFTFMEYKNSFVYKLCDKYLARSYTPINLGMRGCGNRASIRDLYYQVGIDWKLAKEIIVIYSPSGLERFDFCNDGWPDHFHFKAMWPNNNTDNPNRKNLWDGYSSTLWSEKFEVLEQIGHAQELLNWCKVHNAKLIITPAFDRRYTKKHFEASLNLNIVRDESEVIVKNTSNLIFNNNEASLANLFPWDNMFAPGGYNTFLELALSKEPNANVDGFFFDYLGKGSPNGWITSCSHPSAKAHDLFASYLFRKVV